MKALTALILFFLCYSWMSGEVVTYPAPPNTHPGDAFIAGSDQYAVELIQGDQAVESFVYMMHRQHYTNNSETTSWTNFSFSGKVTVRVRRLDGEVEFCQVLPRSSNIEVRRSGNMVEFDLEKPGHYSVEFQKGIKIRHPMLVFANPLEEDVPSPGDPGVMYFGPGVHEWMEARTIPSDTVVYIAGGAYIKGQFYVEGGRNITLRGRGILSGENYEVRTGRYMVTLRDVDNILVEGLTFIHPPRHNMRLYGRNHVVRNVKFTGWHFSTDGVQPGEGSLVEDCFFMCNDDSIMLYYPNSVARNCVVWQKENGAPVQIGWGGDEDRSNFHVHDLEIIRMESEWDNENLAAFCAIHGARAHKSNFLYENIRIDNADWRLISIVTRPNRWAQWDPGRGSLSNITFRNIEYYGEQRIPSIIQGHDTSHPIFNILFDNVTIGGKRITGHDPDVIHIDAETVSNVKFK